MDTAIQEEGLHAAEVSRGVSLWMVAKGRWEEERTDVLMTALHRCSWCYLHLTNEEINVKQVVSALKCHSNGARLWHQPHAHVCFVASGKARFGLTRIFGKRSCYLQLVLFCKL